MAYLATGQFEAYQHMTPAEREAFERRCEGYGFSERTHGERWLDFCAAFEQQRGLGPFEAAALARLGTRLPARAPGAPMLERELGPDSESGGNPAGTLLLWAAGLGLAAYLVWRIKV